jgi:Flp pilus assembly protein TadG
MMQSEQLRRGRSERGQTLVEGALALLVFFSLLFAVVDCGLVLVRYQSLVERVRSAVRWGVVRPWDGTGEQIANLILYDQPTEPAAATSGASGGYLGLTRENVRVRYQPSSAARPDDEMLSVAIVNFRYQFLSPWIIQVFVNPRPILISAPMAFKSAAL